MLMMAARLLGYVCVREGRRAVFGVVGMLMVPTTANDTMC
jgi:hypothetical protein